VLAIHQNRLRDGGVALGVSGHLRIHRVGWRQIRREKGKEMNASTMKQITVRYRIRRVLKLLSLTAGVITQTSAHQWLGQARELLNSIHDEDDIVHDAIVLKDEHNYLTSVADRAGVPPPAVIDVAPKSESDLWREFAQKEVTRMCKNSTRKKTAKRKKAR
jgi:hypothetical protein